MKDTSRMRANMEKLLRIARGEAGALKADLMDIEGARVTAAAALADLAEKIRAEEAAAGPAAQGELTRYLEGVRARRLNLHNTVATLDSAEENARLALETAFIEIKKLEHLMEVSVATAKRDLRKRDVDNMQEVAMAMARR